MHPFLTRWTRQNAAAIFAAAVVAMPVSAAAQTATAPTFSKDIAPIFQEKCQTCHRPNQVAPMSLLTYQDARPWARSIKQKVQSRLMPPWHVDKTVGIQSFKNDISLSDDQIDLIARWVDSGATQGDPKDMPVAKDFGDDNSWKLAKLMGGEPELIVKAPFIHDGSQDPGQVVEADDRRGSERGPLGPRRRDANHLGRRPQDPASLGRVADSGREAGPRAVPRRGRPPALPTTTTTRRPRATVAPDSSTSGRSARSVTRSAKAPARSSCRARASAGTFTCRRR